MANIKKINSSHSFFTHTVFWLLIVFLFISRLFDISTFHLIEVSAYIINGIQLFSNNFSQLIFSFYSPLNVFFIKLNSIIFGQNSFGWRFLNLFCGILLPILFYYITKKTLGSKEALFALALSAFNQVFIYHSKITAFENLVVVVVLFNLWFFHAYITKKDKKSFLYFITAFICIIFTHKEIAIVFAVACIVSLWGDRESRTLLKSNKFVIFLSLAVVCLLWEFKGFLLNSEETFFNSFHFPEFPYSIVNLFLFKTFNEELVSDEFFYGYNCAGPLEGVVYFVSIILSLKFIKIQPVRFVSVLFVFLWISIFWGFFFEGDSEQYIILFIPAVIFSSLWFTELWERLEGKFFISFIFIFLLFESISFVLELPQHYAKQSIWRVNYQYDFREKDYNRAVEEIIPVLQTYNPSIVVFDGNNFESFGFFVSAKTNIRTVSRLSDDFPLALKRTILNQDDDYKSMLIFCLSSEKYQKYQVWAFQNNYDVKIFSVNIPFDNEFVLPVISIFIKKKDDLLTDKMKEEFKEIFLEENFLKDQPLLKK